MSYCPYSEDELEEWDGCTNPMGDACNSCDDYDCEHNPNPDPDAPYEGWEDPMEKVYNSPTEFTYECRECDGSVKLDEPLQKNGTCFCNTCGTVTRHDRIESVVQSRLNIDE